MEGIRSVVEAETKRRALAEINLLAAQCEKCPQLVASRSRVVVGAGSSEANVVFVGEAPGASEDLQGQPFVGAAGRILTELLEGIGLSREEVFITSLLKCHPADNRDPAPEEIANCAPWLQNQLAIIAPTVIVSLGNYATRQLRAKPEGITAIHGYEEVVYLGGRRFWLYPTFHPAAALYNRASLALLKTDFAQIPDLIARGPA